MKAPCSALQHSVYHQDLLSTVWHDDPVWQISNWEVMEKVKEMARPFTFPVFKVSTRGFPVCTSLLSWLDDEKGCGSGSTLGRILIIFFCKRRSEFGFFKFAPGLGSKCSLANILCCVQGGLGRILQGQQGHERDEGTERELIDLLACLLFIIDWTKYKTNYGT